MKQNPNNRGRTRGRGGPGKGKPSNRGQSYDGGSQRGRGNASQQMDKYLTLAREAAGQDDRILAEHYYQHADHYYRVLQAASQAAPQQAQPQQQVQPQQQARPVRVEQVDPAEAPQPDLGGGGKTQPELALDSAERPKRRGRAPRKEAADEPQEQADPKQVA